MPLLDGDVDAADHLEKGKTNNFGREDGGFTGVTQSSLFSFLRSTSTHLSMTAGEIQNDSR